jgi:hypothetical protein
MTSNEGLDDPLLKELLSAFKEDSQRLAFDILNGLWLQAAVAIVALVLAVTETVRLILSYLYSPFPGFARAQIIGRELQFSTEVVLTIVLFILSVLSLHYYLILRARYSRIASLAQKLGR